MQAKVALTEAEYLRTSFPGLDREFRDGEVVERSMPDWFHSRAQINLAFLFRLQESTLNIQVASELRVKLRPRRYLIPDVCVFWPAEPPGKVPDRLPLIAIEILSDDDKLSAVRGKLQEYSEWGVRHVWLVDPHRKVFYTFQDGLHEVKSLTAAEVPLTLTPAEVFE